MRIFVSTTFQDLREHRAAAIRVLRQLGHEVVAMEDFVADGAEPLKRVLEDVKRCDAYVGIFAWRYGFVPKRSGDPARDASWPELEGAEPDSTSITHYEYLQAKASNAERATEGGVPILAFLLDESYPWPPHLIDGFAPNDPSAPKSNACIRALRGELQLARIVAYFTSPADLEARVSAAVTVAGMSKRVNLNLVALGDAADTVTDSDPWQGIRQSICYAGQQRVLRIDLATTWWSTRLFLTAALADWLTDVRRIVVMNGTEFVGMLSTSTILSTLAVSQPTLARVLTQLNSRRATATDVESGIDAAIQIWTRAFPEHKREQAAMRILTPDLMRRWFGDAMLRQPVRIVDLARASVVDLLRMLDYPNDFVPVFSRTVEQASELAPASPRETLTVVDKAALDSQLAQSYVVELMDRARIV